jgi:protocatechuate 3,4-dioxygenase beta subunit
MPRHISAIDVALGVLALVLGMSPSPIAAQGGGGRVGGPGRGLAAPGPAGQGRAGRGNGPDRDGASQSAAVGTGEISGVVVVLGTGTPVRRAQITLSGQELRGQRSAVTDDQGRFAFHVLPAGRFNLSASKAGHVTTSYGAKRPGRPGTPIQLVDGQKIDKLAIALPRGSVITGVVVDEHGEPAPNTQVRALRYVMQTGERTLTFAGQDMTDDRGVYRIFSLQPGDYVLSAIPRNLNPVTDMRQLIMSQAAAFQEAVGQMPAGGSAGFMLGNIGAMASSPGAQQAIDQLAQQLGLPEAPQAAAYAPVYYPGTATPSGAATISLSTSEERSGVDFQLQLVATAKIHGSVVSQDGTLPSNVQLFLAAVGANGTPIEPQPGTSVTRADGSGQFNFREITPGQYALQARAVIRRADPSDGARAGGPGRGFGPVPPNQIAQVLWASTDLSVNGQDITDLQLVLQPGMSVAGRVEFRSAAASPPADLRTVRLSMTPRPQRNTGPGGAPVGQVDEFGRFTINGVAPGHYSLTGFANQNGRGRGNAGAAGPTANTNWTLSAAIVDGRDALDFPLEIAPHENIKDAVLTFTDRTQELSGRIQDASGRPTADFTIVVFPTDNRFWLARARRITATRPGTDGSFIVRGLPPGDYRLTAVTDIEPGEWYDPNFLTQLMSVSIPITLQEGEKKVQDIKVAN